MQTIVQLSYKANLGEQGRDYVMILKLVSLVSLTDCAPPRKSPHCAPSKIEDCHSIFFCSSVDETPCVVSLRKKLHLVNKNNVSFTFVRWWQCKAVAHSLSYSRGSQTSKKKTTEAKRKIRIREMTVFSLFSCHRTIIYSATYHFSNRTFQSESFFNI